MCIVFSPTNVDRDDSLAFEIICRYFYRLKWELGSSQGMYSCSGRLTCHSPLSPSSVSATTKSLKDLSYVVPRLTQHSVFDVWPLDACTKLSLVSHTSSESASSDRQVALSLRSVTVVVFRQIHSTSDITTDIWESWYMSGFPSHPNPFIDGLYHLSRTMRQQFEASISMIENCYRVVFPWPPRGVVQVRCSPWRRLFLGNAVKVIEETCI